MFQKINSLQNTLVTLYGRVADDDGSNLIFNYELGGTKYSINCIRNKSSLVSDINNGETVELKGTINITSNNQIECKIISLKNGNENDTAKTRYYNILTQVNKKKSILNKLNQQKINIPAIISNIGFILINFTDEQITLFKENLTGKIVGNFRYINLKTNITDEFIRAYEYYKNYHNVQMICIVSDNMTWCDIKDIHEVKIINYLKNSKKSIYTTTCFINCVDHQNILNMYADKVFLSVAEIVDLIKSTQSTYMNRIQKLNNIMNQKISIYNSLMNSQLIEMRRKINIYVDENFETENNTVPVNKYYETLIKIISQRMINIVNKKIQRVDSDINSFINQFYKNKIDSMTKKYKSQTIESTEPTEPVPKQPTEQVPKQSTEQVPKQPIEQVPKQPTELDTKQPTEQVPKQPTEPVPSQSVLSTNDIVDLLIEEDEGDWIE